MYYIISDSYFQTMILTHVMARHWLGAKPQESHWWLVTSILIEISLKCILDHPTDKTPKRPISLIPECTCPISHNATLCNRNVHMCTFLLQNGALWDMGLMHCGTCTIGPIDNQHLFRLGIGTDHVTSHYLNQWWQNSLLTQVCITKPQWVERYESVSSSILVITYKQLIQSYMVWHWG